MRIPIFRSSTALHSPRPSLTPHRRRTFPPSPSPTTTASTPPPASPRRPRCRRQAHCRRGAYAFYRRPPYPPCPQRRRLCEFKRLDHKIPALRRERLAPARPRPHHGPHGRPHLPFRLRERRSPLPRPRAQVRRGRSSRPPPALPVRPGQFFHRASAPPQPGRRAPLPQAL